MVASRELAASLRPGRPSRRAARLRPGFVGCVLLGLVLAACQGATTPAVPATATPAPTATPTERPVSLGRPTDIPTDGSCVPNHQCLGLLAAGTYHSANFERGFSFTIAHAGWQNLEEVPWALPLLPIDHPGDALVFFRDPRASTDDGRILPSVGADVPSIVAWFVANPSLTVTVPVDVTVGGLPGSRFDVSVAAGATNTDAGCPVRVCVAMLVGSAANGQYWGWGLAGPERVRIYLVTAETGTLAIIVDSVDETSFADLTARASEILATVEFD